jgi:hypothetical protein
MAEDNNIDNQVELEMANDVSELLDSSSDYYDYKDQNKNNKVR